jgi:hypothetical protein
MQIGGRPIRTELATARSTGYFRRLDGRIIEAAEFKQVFDGFDLIKAWPPTKGEKVFFNLSEGCFVDFGSHDEFKRAIKVSASSLPPLSSLLLPIIKKLISYRLSPIHLFITSTHSSLKLVKDITAPTSQLIYQRRVKNTLPDNHTAIQVLANRTIGVHTHDRVSLHPFIQAITNFISKSLHSSTTPTTRSQHRSTTTWQ